MGLGRAKVGVTVPGRVSEGFVLFRIRALSSDLGRGAADRRQRVSELDKADVGPFISQGGIEA